MLFRSVYMANQRRGTADVKTRAEVSGGGIKPWKQKGTGRARHGSIRSPIWVHGGIAHGPKSKDWSLKMPQKMRIAALFSALSEKAKNKKIIILDDLKTTSYSTKKMNELIKKFSDSTKIGLVIPKSDEKIMRSSRNIEGVYVKAASDLNAFYILGLEEMVVVKSSLDKIYETFLK